ncbi:MAG: hypothetical protein RIB98_13315 [Acidimicrobiales bacterium]
MKFDIEKYKSVVGRLDDRDIDYDGFRTRPLSEDALRCLRYMHDVELHTACYLRDLLVTPAHKDPEMTTFLTCWAFEELWHGEAIGKVLAAHAEPFGNERVTEVRSRLRDRLDPLVMMVTSSLSRHFSAVHMTWGAVNEWTTQAGYARLVQRADHPTLTALLRRIMKQEGRHIDFYASQAGDRLADSRLAQRLTRSALTRAWRPVGSSVMPEAETSHLITYLFGGDDGLDAAARIDRHIDRLPGLAGLGLIVGTRVEVVADSEAAAEPALALAA